MFRIFFLLSFVILFFVIIFIDEYSKNDFNLTTNRSKILFTIIDDFEENRRTIEHFPSWIDEYELREFFDFSWFYTGAYQWHLKQMSSRTNNERREQFHNLINIVSHLRHHPERGVFIDTKSDRFRSIFPRAPRTSYSLSETCEHLQLINDFYPCRLPPEEYPSTQFQSLVTFALYDVMIEKTTKRTSIEHFHQIIYLFDHSNERFTRLLFIRHYLPRLIRLFALVPIESVILLPFSTIKIDFVRQYLILLEHQGLINNRTRFIRFDRQKTYHAHVVYSTSSPRFDLLLLHRILFDRFQTDRQDLIVILRRSISADDFQGILQTIQLFEYPTEYRHLRVYTIEDSRKHFDLHQIRHVFVRSLIVIGRSSEELSQIIWCLPSTHIVEIGRRNMSADIYEMTIELNFHYWLVRTIDDEENHLDRTDFRQLFLQLLTTLVDQSMTEKKK